MANLLFPGSFTSPLPSSLCQWALPDANTRAALDVLNCLRYPLLSASDAKTWPILLTSTRHTETVLVSFQWWVGLSHCFIHLISKKFHKFAPSPQGYPCRLKLQWFWTCRNLVFSTSPQTHTPCWGSWEKPSKQAQGFKSRLKKLLSAGSLNE